MKSCIHLHSFFRTLPTMGLFFCLALGQAALAQTLFTEDFEGDFPGTNWVVGDSNPLGIPAYWGDVDFAFGGGGAHGGSRKGYCAAIGYGGTSNAPTYPDSMTAYMRRTIDLSGYTSATLNFWHKIPSIEATYDVARVKLDSTILWARDTPSFAWSQVVLNLSAFVGGSHMLSFEVASDDSVSYAGWYLDDISVTLNTPPPNDDFASALVLTSAIGSSPGGNGNATREPGEPNHAGNAGGHSVWYSFTAPATGPMLFDTAGSAFDTLLAVYTGSSLGSLALVANSDDIDSMNLQSRVSFNAVAGQAYLIALDGKDGASGTLVLNHRFGGLPDLIINAAGANPQVVFATFASNSCEVVEGCAIPGTRRLLRFDTESWNIGTGDLYFGDPDGNPLFHYASCHGHYHFEDFAVYRLRRTNDGEIVAVGGKVGFCLVDVIRISSNAPLNSLYNCINQGIQAGWGDVYDKYLPCQHIDITGLSPGAYLLELESDPSNLIAESNESNNISTLLVTIPPECTGAPGNDNFTSAWVITNVPVATNGYNACATKEVNEPRHAGSIGGHSIWYRWTAPTAGSYVISTEGSDFDTTLGVYTGTTVSSLTTITANDNIDSGNSRSRVTINAAAGTTYYIAVAGATIGVAGGVAAVGTVALSIDPPVNDRFSNCVVLAGSSGFTNGHNFGAAREADEPAHFLFPAQHSVWYCWTAPVSAIVQFDTEGSAFDTRLAVYTGSAVNLLTAFASDDDSGAGVTSKLTFAAVGGTTYRIAVDSSSTAMGWFTLRWAVPPVLAGVPADATVPCDAVPAAATPSATSTCGGLVSIALATTRADGNCANRYTLTRTWTATDACGNQSSGSQILTVVDAVAPAIACPDNTSVLTTNLAGTAVSFTVTAMDLCSGSVTPVCTPASGAVFPLGSSTVNCTAADACNNASTCSFTVTVLLNHAPVAGNNIMGVLENHPRAVAIEKLLANDSDSDGDPLAIVAVSATSTNGSGVTLSSSEILYTPVANFVGLDSFSYTVSDGRGGLATATAAVHVLSMNDASLNRIGEVTVTANGVRISFAGIPGFAYSVERSANLSGWTPIGGFTVHEFGIADFEDAAPLAGAAFYRIVMVE